MNKLHWYDWLILIASFIGLMWSGLRDRRPKKGSQ